MNPVNIQKLAVSFGLFSFGFLFIGSILTGATILTGFIRGIVGALFFALVVWLSGILFLQEDDGNNVEVEEQEEEINSGTQLDQKV